MRGEIKKISREEINEFAENIRREKKVNKEGDSEKILTIEDEEDLTPEPNPESSDEGPVRSGYLKKKRKSLISEKGMRHVSRLIKLISGKQLLQSIFGLVEEKEIKILLDFREKFNVITEAAIKLIKANQQKLKRIKNFESIPEYLKREKKVRIKAVKLEIIVKQKRIVIKAMILNNDVSCALLGREACRELGGKLREKPQENSELKRWSEHLTEATRRRLLMEEEQEKEKSPRKRKSTIAYAKDVKRTRISDENFISNETRKNTKEEHAKDHGHQFEMEKDPAATKEPDIVTIEDPEEEGESRAAQSRESAVRVRNLKGNLSKKCNKSAKSERQKMSVKKIEKTENVKTLRSNSNKIDISSVKTIYNNSDKIIVRNIEAYKDNSNVRNKKTLDILKCDSNKKDRKRLKISELNEIDGKLKHLESLVKSFKRNKLKENREDIEIMIKELKNDINQKHNESNSSLLERDKNDMNETESIDSQNSIEISMSEVDKMAVTSTPKRDRDKKNVKDIRESDTNTVMKKSIEEQKHNSSCGYRMKDKNDITNKIKIRNKINLSGNSFKLDNKSNGKLENKFRIRDINELIIEKNNNEANERHLEKQNSSNKQDNSLESKNLKINNFVLSQDSLIEKLELNRNNNSSLVIDNSNDTIIISTCNENEIKNDLNEIERLKKMRKEALDRILRPKSHGA
ncbi:unnamed protein product [Lasius platythorax]|uniref:Uncharacterized protein n=1 Tax=Lasius platythorax TaxID=488582 RepID=A0AAV2MZJ1_9HYME